MAPHTFELDGPFLMSNIQHALYQKIAPYIPPHPILRYIPYGLRRLKLHHLGSMVATFSLYVYIEHLDTIAIKKDKLLKTTPFNDKKEALHDCVHLLQALGYTPFLAYGTLLGCIRDQTLLTTDNDVDLGLFWTQDIDISLLCTHLRQSPFRIIRKPKRKKNDRFKLKHTNGIFIDLVLFTPIDEHTLENYVLFSDYSFRRTRSSFGLKNTQFLGMTVTIPDPPERFLDEHYGNWRTPCPPFYHTYISPALPSCMPQVLFDGLAKEWLLSSMRFRNRTIAKHCIDTIVHKRPAPLWLYIQERLHQAS